MKKMTVLLPCYNDSSLIKYSVKSILNQTFQDFTLLIIDDGSTDNTEEVIKSYTDPRISFIKKEHSGLADTLNYGLKISETEIIARMDADDISLQYRLEKQYNFFQLNNNFDIISSWYAIFTTNRLEYVVRTSEKSEEIEKKLLLYSEICHPSALFKKNKILKLGGFKNLTDENVFEDYELWLRSRGVLKFYNLQEVLIFQRYRKNSLSRENLKTKYKVHYYIQEPYYQKEEINKFGIKNPEEEIIFRGWREYFYGDKQKARYFWLKSGIAIFRNISVLIAFVISFLPEDYFIQFKENRIRFRILYYLKYYSRENIKLRKIFTSLLKQYASS